jgi:hypothetical protein
MKGGKLPLSSMDEKAGWYSQYGWRKWGVGAGGSGTRGF